MSPVPDSKTGNQKALAALAILLAVCLSGAVWLARRNAERAASLAKLERENAELKARASRPDTFPPAKPEASAHPPGVEKRAAARHPAVSPASVEQAGLLVELEGKLGAANATVAELESRLGSIEANLQKLSAENERLTASEAELRDRLASTTRLVEALQAELKSRNERLAQLELANRSLRDTSASVSHKLDRLTGASREMEEINRRREAHLNNLLRRYRELTDQYRAASLRLMDQAEGGARMPPGELSRIESAVAMAEDELKQLTALNAQAARVLGRTR